jgi:hypothetical protein
MQAITQKGSAMSLFPIGTEVKYLERKMDLPRVVVSGAHFGVELFIAETRGRDAVPFFEHVVEAGNGAEAAIESDAGDGEPEVCGVAQLPAAFFQSQVGDVFRVIPAQLFIQYL